MTSADRRVLRRLNHLYRMCRAGEKGFAVVAANVNNRGLKLILKTLAYQRAQFADQLKQEIQRLGGRASERDSLRGIIHRGRIDILATLTIGAQNVENLVLGEALLGESAALRAYRRALAAQLPAETRSMVETQHRQIAEAREQVALLRGKSGERLVVRLFDSEQDVEAARRALESASFRLDNLETMDARQVTHVYHGKGSRVSEAMISGAVGGALWGSLIGALAGLSVAFAPGIPQIANGPQVTWAAIALGGTALGALVAAFLGFVVGTGVSEEDAYIYGDSVKHGIRLVRLRTEAKRAAEAAHIMRQINAAARARTTEGALPTSGAP